MSDEKPNGSEANVRRAFRAKLSPGPKEEVIVLAADAVRAVELLGERFDWKNIELSRIDEAQLIEDDPQEPSSLPSADTMRLRSCLSYIRQVAYGENPHIAPGIIPDYAEEELQSVIKLRANYERRVQERDRLTREIKTWKSHMADCRRVATGEIVNLMDCLAGPSAALSAILDLKQKLEAMEKRWRDATAFKPAPPGPVPTSLLGEASNPKPIEAEVTPAPMPVAPSDSIAYAMRKSQERISKRVEETRTGAAKKEGESAAQGSPPMEGVDLDMELSCVRSLREKYPKEKLKWQLWRVGPDKKDRIFYLAPCAEGREAVFIYWPLGDVFRARVFDDAIRGAVLLAPEISANDEIFILGGMKKWGITP